jgi:HTH-type transcriptional regulator / antitoxin HigA
MTPARLNTIAKAKSYKSLVEQFPPRIIDSAASYNASLKVVERLMELPSLSKDQAAYLELLADLVEQYEKAQFPLKSPTLPELLAHLIESRGVPQSQVAKEAGVSPTLLSDVQAGRRGLSLEAIRKLSTYFGVDASLFVEAATGDGNAAA